MRGPVPRLSTAVLALIDLPLSVITCAIAVQLATPAQRWFIFSGSVAYLALGIVAPVVALAHRMATSAERSVGIQTILLFSLGLNLLVIPVDIIALSM